MESTQEPPVERDNVEEQSVQEPQPVPKPTPNFRDILSQENRTQSSSSIFVVVDGKEIPKPAKVPNDTIIEMVKEVEGRDSIDDGLKNEDVVAIRDTKTKRGHGIFATGDFLSDHVIIAEQPALSFYMPQEVSMANMRREFEVQWCDLLVPQQDALKAEFPKLRLVASGRRQLSLLQSIHLYNFALEYSYSSPDGDFANIYSLASYINHACRRCANAVQGMEWHQPHRVLIRLIKPVEAGEEIFIHYNTAEGRKLACAVCGSMADRPSRCQALRNKLKEWRLKLTGGSAEASDATSAGVVEEDDFNADVPGPRLSLMDRAKRLRNKAVRRWGYLFVREGCDWTLPWRSPAWQSPPRTPYPDSPSPGTLSPSAPFLRAPPPTTVGSPVRRQRKSRSRGTRM
ncbi:hypothetical protein BBK36DRAFT_1124959 [Trichoderma citrinoviride]|uniref:SET domain-containing protein n=1 Tax=Trichoderma citrinoviride TaxID=58853 RepID=A0A2T4B5D0_9HYPO|nr:hypothetical protein BBK36DRAFT_1124959 [Trichoderma citrinoviride]PTB64478.1 hypothetical protein BBK36DRAFT_1124959 [Trichoderma citrinoviride]